MAMIENLPRFGYPVHMVQTARKFQKSVAATAVMALMLVTLLALGVWQVQRLQWKTALLDTVAQQSAAAPVALPATVDDPTQWAYRRVILTGKYIPAGQVRLQPRTQQGRVGYHLLMPFRTTAGAVVFVNRGFVPDDMTDALPTPQTRVTVEGVVQVPQKSYFTPDNRPDQNLWYWADIPALTQNASLPAALPVVVTLPPVTDGRYPAGYAVAAQFSNNHLQYAIFWFGMAFILVIVYTMSQRKTRT